jgi:hypothetical protein
VIVVVVAVFAMAKKKKKKKWTNQDGIKNKKIKKEFFLKKEKC